MWTFHTTRCALFQIQRWFKRTERWSVQQRYNEGSREQTTSVQPVLLQTAATTSRELIDRIREDEGVEQWNTSLTVTTISVKTAGTRQGDDDDSMISRSDTAFIEHTCS